MQDTATILHIAELQHRAGAAHCAALEIADLLQTALSAAKRINSKEPSFYSSVVLERLEVAIGLAKRI